MASDASSVPVNGVHAAETSPSAAQNSTNSDISKDEVGWYFVEQYYTTLSRNPDKLFLFYNKRSQFVLGDETDKVAVCVGQKSINERIKELDFNECKVRVTNVDSQASDSNILIQVIGEISNKSQPHKKFVQTFVLATQTNGYFVLNDIFRYLVDEEEEPLDAQMEETAAEEAASVQPVQESATLTSSEDPMEIEQSAQAVDREIEQKLAPSSEGEVTIPNGTAATPEVEEETVPEIAPATATLEEKPKEPVVTPAVSPPKKEAQPAPVTNGTTSAAPAPTKPAVPKTWAGLLAGSARVATPVAPAAQTPAQTQSQPKAAPAAAAPTQAPTAPAADTASPSAPSPAAEQQDEWTSVGDKKQSRAQANNTTQETAQNRAYIKNVHENVDAKALKALLEKFGEITYFDVAKQKNCAFVDFKTAEGYKAAVEANPHQLGNDRIFVEERRTKPGQFPFPGARGGMRGGRGGASGPQQGNRGGFQGNARGGFAPRGGRGGAQGGKPRGGAQAA